MGHQKMRLLATAALWAFYLSAITVCGWGEGPAASIVRYEQADLASEERLGAHFERWRRRHGKVYRKEGEGERERRFRSFRENLAYIDRRNQEKRGESQRVGLNRFADLTNEEFRAIYTKKIRKPVKRWGEDNRRKRELMASCDASASLDWRKKGIVTPVKDQGECVLKNLIKIPKECNAQKQLLM